MAFCHRNSERKLIPHDYRRQEQEVVGSLCRLGSRPVSPKSLLEQEKRIQREIANSNERRRMQSINAGFQSLRNLLPHREGEKLSKAAILQSTIDYVNQLEQEKVRLLEQNCQLSRRMLNSPHHDSDGSCSDFPVPKRKKHDADSVDEGIGISSPSRSEIGVEDVKQEIIELRLQLEQEKTQRLILEEQIRNFESRHIRLQYHSSVQEQVKCSSALNLGHKNGLGSPPSQISSQDIKSNQELSLRESSPDLSSTELPKDLSDKSNPMHPLVDDISLSDMTRISELIQPRRPISSLRIEIVSKNTLQVSTSRQNLKTIFEAARHVEGDHMFKDDPTPNNCVHQSIDSVKTPASTKTEQDYVESSRSVLPLSSDDFSFQHPIMGNASPLQSRPGVIVSNLS